ncbi:MAG TPA: substrate-binding domain-containing protein [Phycisphaerae bacterium]|nr:substrate-binding domain-containing protein [Phycisphaerae bacterium]HRY68986.1 substrate-binding domain-containing protein [Phycisphaerae bacterium]HSA26040.1 substrate-binding domain-containing protein [Phycisphaerae bacterium]
MKHLLSTALIITASSLSPGCKEHSPAPGTPAAPASPVASSANRHIAVIPKGMTHEFWKAMEAGARKAATEIGNVEIDYKSSAKEDDTQTQISLVQNFVSTRVDAIVLAPLSDQALVAPVRLAGQAKIPVVITDSPLAAQVGKDFIAYVGTDNYKAGVLAGKRMGELMHNQGTVMVLRYAESSASTRQREDGFLNTMTKESPGVAIIDPPQYAGSDVTGAKRAAENMITAHMDKFQGVFCPNETTTAGMLIALEARQLAGKTQFVGFDSQPRLIAGLKDRKLMGIVLQDPYKMGYIGVKSAIDYLEGKTVTQNVDTGATLATPDNLETPEIQRLLYPLAQ